MSDKIKTLSQAIRLGATFRPQCYAATFGFIGGGERGSCALGAAYEAIGATPKRTPTWEAIVALRNRFPNVSDYIYTKITDRNDSLKQPREQIADWLESQGL